MPQLGPNKQILLNQLRSNPAAASNFDNLLQLLKQYDDLLLEDLRPYIDNETALRLEEATRNPQEKAAWDAIQIAPRSSVNDIKDLMAKVASYIRNFPTGPKIADVRIMENNLAADLNEAIERQAREEAARREENDWLSINRNSLSSLQSYMARYPQSVHINEIDDAIWRLTGMSGTTEGFSRYMSLMPTGAHIGEANDAIAAAGIWEPIRMNRDIEQVAQYIQSYPTSPYINQARALMYDLKDHLFEDMRENMAKYGINELERLIGLGIISQAELEDKGLITPESWEALYEDRDAYPNLQEYMIADPNLSAPEGCTDIFLFGIPGTGKTCLLMGIAGANGEGYRLDMRNHGGRYASALQQYVLGGLAPGGTFGNYVTVINGEIWEDTKRGRVDHAVNFVEMSGEEFARRIADGESATFSELGTGATNLMSNNNRKLFFIIVDCTKDRISFEYEEEYIDSTGNPNVRLRKKYVSQLDILNKFASMFDDPSNKAIMDKVDAIHFIVTKADMLGDVTSRDNIAVEYLKNNYTGPVSSIANYCRRSRRINYSTDYAPQAFTFSLGDFYAGNVYKLNKADTHKLIHAISAMTWGNRQSSFIDRVRDWLTNGN